MSKSENRPAGCDRIRRRSAGIIIIALSFIMALAQGALAAGGTWAQTAPLPGPRQNHTATLLANGKVLVAGGTDASGAYLKTALLYDPAGGTWTATDSLPSDLLSLSGHTASLLPNGKVLVVGGFNSSALTQALLYDPVTGTWTSATGSLTIYYLSGHTATLLGNGKILVAGGYVNMDSTTKSGELYDPVTGTWTLTDPLIQARQGHRAILLGDGRVLVVGGYYRGSVGGPAVTTFEFYDPVGGTWSPTAPLTNHLGYHTATLLPNGKVLVAGGSDSSGSYLNKAMLFDPAGGTWIATGSLSTGRQQHTATLLPNGKVLVAAGMNAASSYLASAEIYDPATGGWTATGSFTTARSNAPAVQLQNGKVLMVGGVGASGVLASCMIYTPPSNISPVISLLLLQ
jgi:N-acetylneuraminic acid mutarotase